MKKRIHPKYCKLKIILTNEKHFHTRSCYEIKQLKLDVDTKTHSAWTRQEHTTKFFINKQIKKHKEKYGNLLN